MNPAGLADLTELADDGFGFDEPEAEPPLPSAVLTALSKRLFPIIDQTTHKPSEEAQGPRRGLRLTVGLRRIPEHNTAERGVLAARLARDFRERRGVDVARAGSGAGRGRADEDLDVLVERRFLRPAVPLVEVPRVGVVEVCQRAEVVVELDVDRVELCGVQYPVMESGMVFSIHSQQKILVRIALTWTCTHRGTCTEGHQ